MYETKIEINDKVIPVRFGAYVVERLEDEGIYLSELEEHTKKPVGLIKKLLFHGAVNAIKGKDESQVSIDDIYDWMDEVGMMEYTGILRLFTDSLTKGVPKANADSLTKGVPKANADSLTKGVPKANAVAKKK